MLRNTQPTRFTNALENYRIELSVGGEFFSAAKPSSSIGQGRPGAQVGLGFGLQHVKMIRETTPSPQL